MIQKWVDIEEKNIAIDENEKIHARQLDYLSNAKKIKTWANSAKTYWRGKTLNKFELFSGKEIEGTVVEVGAGTGFCSALISKRKNVKKIYALDFEMFSLEKLMPNVFEALGAKEDKIERVLGSYDDMKLEDNSIDLIVGMGALHHSQDLKTSFNEFYRVLKPGGYVLISDPAYSNGMSLKEELNWRESIKKDGSKAKDNGDQKFRLCQWESNALESGFEIYPFVFSKKGVFNRIYSHLFGNNQIRKGKTYSNLKPKVLYPFFGKHHELVKIRGILEFFWCPPHDVLMMFMQKPNDHTYKAMSENVYLNNS